MHWSPHAVHVNNIKATVNDILLHWRSDWPGGLDERDFSTLNLLAQCRQGPLGFNRVECRDCHHKEWYASSCGNRHCPNCLGPRQAEWSEKLCGRLPDCPHFHVVFTLPDEVQEFFELNYRACGDILFAAAAETLKLFQRNNWGMEGGSFAVLHTWGSALNWHPHLHMLVSSGGRDLAGRGWRQARPNYLFPVRAMSKVFGAIFLRRLETLESRRDIRWPEGLDTLEARREWRVRLAGRHWNIFSRATLANTRAVVRYLARYTSRIAMSNRRITSIDEERRSVTFEVKDYRNGGRKREITMSGKAFLWSFSRHLVPKGYRRIRCFGLLAGKRNRHRELKGAPQGSIAEKAPATPVRSCPKCRSERSRNRRFPRAVGSALMASAAMVESIVREWVGRYSLGDQDRRPAPS